jgi:hypothetical protein
MLASFLCFKAAKGYAEEFIKDERPCNMLSGLDFQNEMARILGYAARHMYLLDPLYSSLTESTSVVCFPDLT